MGRVKMISVIGSTGSIGTQALSVAKKHNISVKSLAAAFKLGASCKAVY